MSEPLFDLTVPPGMELHSCDLCPAAAIASTDTLRVIGWVVFDGESLTGKPLHVRICRACRLKENR